MHTYCSARKRLWQAVFGIRGLKTGLKKGPAIPCEALERRLLFSLPTTWTSVGAGGGGSFFEPSFNPGNPSEIWVATDQTDEYHSTNGGASWTVPSFTEIQGNHAAPVQYTDTPNLLFALGPSNYPEESTNDGQTWTLLPNNPASNADSFIVNYNNPNEFFISSYSQIFFTSNGGASYLTLPTDGYDAGAVFDGNDIYICTDQGLYTSTNGGSSFTSTAFSTGLPSGDGIFSFAGETANGTTTFFAVTASESDIYPGQEGNICYSFTGVYEFTVGQSSWTAVGGIPSGVDPAFVSMVPGDTTDVLLAGGSSSGAPTVIETNNGGGSWSNLFDTTDNANIETGWQGYGGIDYGWGYGEFAMGFAQNPADPAEMMITDEGGAYLSTNGGALWQAVYVNPADLNAAGSPTPTDGSYEGNGMENTSSWWLTFTGPNTILASFTDITGDSSDNGGTTWNFNDNNGNPYNTTYQIVSQPVTNNLYAAVSSIHDIYQWDAYQTNTRIDAGNGAVLFSTNGGSSWNMLHNFDHPVVYEAIDPNNPDTMYVSVASSTAGGIYMTTDLQDGANSVWTQLATPPRTEGHPLDIVVLNDGTLVVTYAGTLNSSSGLFDDSAGVFVSTNQGESWTDTTANMPAMQYFDRDITIDPNDPTQSTWYVGVWETTSDPYYPEGGLYKTTNRGLTWTLVPGLPTKEFSQVAFNPSNTNEMYVTTGDDGLWYTADAESATPTFQQVTSYPFAAPQRVFFNPYNPNQVWVTSFGYGLAVGLMSPTITTDTWTGIADGVNWNNPGNWSTDSVPTSADSVIIPIGAKPQLGSGTFSVGSLTLLGNATIDLQDATLFIDYGSSADPISTIASYLTSGYNGGAWNGTGIISSSVAAENTSQSALVYSVGYADGADGIVAGLSSGEIEIMPALAGDAKLQGNVDFGDFQLLSQYFGQSGGWDEGNFAYGSTIDFADFQLLSQNFGQSAALATSAAASSLFTESSIVPDTEGDDPDSWIF
jgi:hypothetical protein